MDLIKPNFEEGGVGDIVPYKGRVDSLYRGIETRRDE
jgi:hypothetical protein